MPYYTKSHYTIGIVDKKDQWHLIFADQVVISFSVMFSQLSITPAPKPASPDIPAVAPERITFVTYQVSLWLAVVSLLELLVNTPADL
jgi:hypothetical protein